MKINMTKTTRNTKQKKEIIHFLENNPNIHISIQDIKNNMSEEVGLTTIYRVINHLIDDGLVIKHPLENSQGFCYQYNKDIENCSHNNHYHLICEYCNTLFHCDTDEFSKIFNTIENDFDFEINSQKVAF